MKTLLLFTISWFILYTNTHAEKRALIVAIGNYEKANDQWQNISSLNDIPLIMSILRQNKFTDTVVLRDRQATKSNIIAAANQLLSRSQPGDIVIFHFSTHGQQIDALKGDEVVGKDEAIVAWGAPAVAYGKYHGEKHLCHNEIKTIRNKFLNKLGREGELLFFFDACYSGGLTRGIGKIRGGHQSIKARNWEQFNSNKLDKNDTLDDLKSNKAAFVAISACRSDEKNAEDIWHNCGSLSYAITKAFINAKPNETYESLFASINNAIYDVNKFQHPVIEGSTNRLIFNGKVIPKDNHIAIIKLDDKPPRCLINTGLLYGVTNGSLLEAYTAGEGKKNSKPIFTLEVTKAGLITSEAILVDTLIPNLKRTAYWLYVKYVNINDCIVNVGLDSVKGDNLLSKELTNLLEKDLEIKIVKEKPDIFIGCDYDNKKFRIIDAQSGQLIREIENTPSELKSFIITYGQYCALQKIDIKNPEYMFSLRIESENENKHLNTDCSNKQGLMVITEGDNIRTIIKNPQNRKLYLNMLYFEADGTYNIIKPCDRKIDALDSITINARASSPYGYGMLMCIGTPYPIHLDECIKATKMRSLKQPDLNNIFFNKLYSNSNSRGYNDENEIGFTIKKYFIINPQ